MNSHPRPPSSPQGGGEPRQGEQNEPQGRVPLRLRLAERVPLAPRGVPVTKLRTGVRPSPGCLCCSAACSRRPATSRPRLSLCAVIKTRGEYTAPRDRRRFLRAPRHHPLRAEPVLPGEHPADHARRRRGEAARLLRGALRGRGVRTHVGRAQEDGRARRDRGPRCVESGLPGERFLARIPDQAVKDTLLENTELGCPRNLRLAHVLRRRGDVLRQGSPARGGGGDRGAKGALMGWCDGVRPCSHERSSAAD